MAITFGVNLSVDNYWDVPEFAWRAEDLGSLITISSSSSKVKNLCAISFLLFFVNCAREVQAEFHVAEEEPDGPWVGP